MISVFIHYIGYLYPSSYACNYTIKVSCQMFIFYAVTPRFYSYISSNIHIYPYLSHIYRITFVYTSMSIDHILMYPVISKFILKIVLYLCLAIYIYLYLSIYILVYPWVSMNIHHMIMYPVISQFIPRHCFISMFMSDFHMYPNSEKASKSWQNGFDDPGGHVQVLMWYHLPIINPGCQCFCLTNDNIYTAFFQGHASTCTCIHIHALHKHEWTIWISKDNHG